MAKCLKSETNGFIITGQNAQVNFKSGKQLKNKNTWSKLTWQSRTEKYYLIADDNLLEGK